MLLRRLITIPGYLIAWSLWLGAAPVWLPIAGLVDLLRGSGGVALRSAATVVGSGESADGFAHGDLGEDMGIAVHAAAVEFVDVLVIAGTFALVGCAIGIVFIGVSFTGYFITHMGMVARMVTFIASLFFVAPGLKSGLIGGALMIPVLISQFVQRKRLVKTASPA